MKKNIPLFIMVVLAISCTDLKRNNSQTEEIKVLHAEISNSKKSNSEKLNDAKGQIATFLTFQKEDAEQAMNFYMNLFDNSEIIDLKRWGKEAPGKEGTIMHATFTLNGKLFMCSDSPPIHAWDFTPAVSNFVECINDSELEHLFTKLSENGKVMMPLGNYGFSEKFGFVEDRFGVSWQLNLQ